MTADGVGGRVRPRERMATATRPCLTCYLQAWCLPGLIRRVLPEFRLAGA